MGASLGPGTGAQFQTADLGDEEAPPARQLGGGACFAFELKDQHALLTVGRIAEDDRACLTVLSVENAGNLFALAHGAPDFFIITARLRHCNRHLTIFSKVRLFAREPRLSKFECGDSLARRAIPKLRC